MRNFSAVAISASMLLAACTASNVASLPSSSNAVQLNAVTSVQQRATGGRQYLYVADQDIYESRERQLIQRFLLRDGIPQKNPGFTIYPSAGFQPGDLIGVDGAGKLYSTLSAFDGPVSVFAPDAKTPAYNLVLPNPAACNDSSSSVIQVSAMTVDSKGHIFVNFATWAQDLHGKHLAPAVAPDGTICSGIWIFAPGSHGKRAPIQTIPLERVRAGTELAVDGSNNLYAAINGTHVVEYANATTKPVRTQVYYDRHHNVGSVAADEAGNVFIGTTVGGGSFPRINRYSTGNFHDGPINSIVPANGGFLATLARHVFVSDGHEIDVYHAYERGPQQSLYTFSSHEIYSLAVGP
jgi:hypothetical protein